MLERNILSHFKLAVLLALLSSSVLLHARLVPDQGEPRHGHSNAGIPMAIVQYVAALAAIFAGCWEYKSDYEDLKNMRAFLIAQKYGIFYQRQIYILTPIPCRPHLAIMTVVAGVVFTTGIVLLADENEL